MTAAHSDTWQLQEAKNRFSALVDHALAHGTQIVTRHGRPVVKVVPIQDEEASPVPASLWAALRASAPPDGLVADAIDDARRVSRVAERRVDFSV